MLLQLDRWKYEIFFVALICYGELYQGDFRRTALADASKWSNDNFLVESGDSKKHVQYNRSHEPKSVAVVCLYRRGTIAVVGSILLPNAGHVNLQFVVMKQCR